MIPYPPPIMKKEKPIIYQADMELMCEVEHLKAKIKRLKKKIRKLSKK